MPNEKTKQDYRNLAKHFYLTRIEDDLTPKKIKDALVKAASDYRPAYWRRLRNAICLDQSERGFTSTSAYIAALKNPLTTSTEKGKNEQVPKKQKRIKKVSPVDLSRITQQLAARQDKLLQSALILVTITGCRPTEMSLMKILDNGLIFIVGAKKREADDRGLDRIIKLPAIHRNKVEFALNLFKKESLELQRKDIKSSIPHLLERRLATITKRIWPRRKHRPTLYSLRHQLASDLKNSGISREEIAYIMGHRATKSADSYGNKKSGGKRSIEAAISANELEKLITVNHHSHPLLSPKETQSSLSLS